MQKDRKKVMKEIRRNKSLANMEVYQYLVM